ncbi:ferritin-like domain-containing protein [Nannocystis pusilla]|uniref:ferritin-like domain-containing protein n=1 Tax=Nannocystis pusilla TaxID=889268 RepID=UPI003DA2CF4D
MNSTRLGFTTSLAALFAALLAGCGDSCSGFDSQTGAMTVELTPEEYAYWQTGNRPPYDPTGGSSSSGDDPTSGTTGGTTGGTSGGVPDGPKLPDDEVCTLVCKDALVGDALDSCSIGEKNAEGKIPVECAYHSVCTGRRHVCVRSIGDTDARGRVGAWLARDAHNEAASVHAFLALAGELAAHGAPAGLLARIEAAARDEARHAELVGALARAHGAELPPLAVAAVPARDLLAIAVENAVEGCVGETWAALIAAHQARAAADPGMCEVYAEIAADEAHHAELAWALDTWLCGQLGPGARARVDAARADAAARLRAVLEDSQDDPALLVLGVPDRARAQHLAAGLDAALWSQAA